MTAFEILTLIREGAERIAKAQAAIVKAGATLAASDLATLKAEIDLTHAAASDLNLQLDQALGVASRR